MFKRRFLSIAVIVAMLTLVFAAQAGAGAGGSVELTNSEVTPFTCVNVGGGTWCYGTEVNGETKHCWSNYKHNVYYHHSTAIVGEDYDTDYASAGYWSDADAYGPWYETAYAYWGIDE